MAKKRSLVTIATILPLVMLAMPAAGADMHPQDTGETVGQARQPIGEPTAEYDDELVGEKVDAQQVVVGATGVVEKMRADPQVAAQLERAKGVFIIPRYTKGAFIAGAEGGAGVTLARTDGGWSNPAFYDVTTVSFGAQAGISTGAIAMLLMNDKALENFKQDSDFSLNAKAGLVIVDLSKNVEVSGKTGDIIVWNDQKGALVDASFNVGDISWNDEQNRAYYGEMVTAEGILGGERKKRGEPDRPEADKLRDALPG